MQLSPATVLAKAPRIALAIGAIAGGAWVARDVTKYVRGDYEISQGGSPHGTRTGTIMGYRHLIGRGLANGLHPMQVWTCFDAERDARASEYELLQGGRHKNGYDNGADAYRHGYGSALMAFRLVRDRGMNAADAAELMRDFGAAHEDDSYLTGVHHDRSREMDLSNNEAGLAIGLRLAADAGAREADVSGALLDAIRGGELVVLDTTTSPLRASRPADLDLPQRDTPVGEEPSGVPSFTPAGTTVRELRAGAH